jgi:hypothetical protein
MVPSEKIPSPFHRNILVRFCFILILVLPAFSAPTEKAVPAGHVTMVVRADQRSGRLVRGAAVEPHLVASGAVTSAPEGITALIAEIAAREGVEDALVHSVIRAESNYNPWAISPKGAQGIMQLIPSTARRFGVANTFDPRENIEGGVRYLKFLLDYYNNDYPKAIAAYNAGENAVDRFGGIPPFPETRDYVLRVAKNLKVARSVRRDATTSVLAGESAETFHPIQTSVGEDGKIYLRNP